MIDFKLLRSILSPNSPTFPHSKTAQGDDLPPDGLTMGTLFIGMQGTGKTTALARHLFEYFKEFPDRPIFVLDWGGTLSNAILGLVAQDPQYERLLKRIVYDEMGHPEWVIPLPEFSYLYDFDTPIMSFESQVERVKLNIKKMNDELVRITPVVGGIAINQLVPNLLRLCTAVIDEFGETWQTTEAINLIEEHHLLAEKLAKDGYKVPSAKYYLQNSFLNLNSHDKDLRSIAANAVFEPISTDLVRARIGYPRPSWTPREAIKKGLMVLVNGHRFKNQRSKLDYLFTQVYSLIMSEMDKRQPSEAQDKPVSLVMDEVYSLFEVPGLAVDISKLSPQYRNVKLQLYIVLQELAQMTKELRDHIWSIGNMVVFTLANFQEAYEFSQQLFPYQPTAIKLPAKTETQQDITEPDRGQYLSIANQIQTLKNRECIMRIFYSESKREKYVLWIKKTKDIPNSPQLITVEELKETLLKDRGVRVRDALEVVNRRFVSRKSIKVPKTRVPPHL